MAIALARILLGKISGNRRPGTGPAPRENASTNLGKREGLNEDGAIISLIKIILDTTCQT